MDNKLYDRIIRGETTEKDGLAYNQIIENLSSHEKLSRAIVPIGAFCFLIGILVSILIK